MEGRVVLEVSGLSVAFGSHAPTTHDVSLTLRAGQTTALVGESGSGKSVTSSAIMGLLPPNGRVASGQVMHVASGQDWLRVGAPRGRGLAMVFQDPMSSLNPSMKIGEQVAESMLVHQGLTNREAGKQVVRLLADVELPDPEVTARKYPHELSGGQKQRVMVALALASNPEVLIADEPTTALDVTVQRSLLLLLQRLQRERGLAILFITHDLGVVEATAHEVVVLRNGHVVESGDLAQIFHSPKHPYTKELLTAYRRPVGHIPHQPAPPLVVAQGVLKSYVTRKSIMGRPLAQFQALKGIDLSIHRGERLGLVGESGSGKSTLGRALIGLTPFDSGRVTFDGTSVEANNRAAMSSLRRRAQLVFQDPYAALNPRMTIGAALREVLITHGHPIQRADDLLTEVGLSPETANKKPGQLSGGQRARVVIARALAVEPEFLVLDESVAALDTAIRESILELLQDLANQRGLTYLFISHDLHVVAGFCDRVAVMHQGQIVESGTAHDVLHTPQHPYTQQLIASQPDHMARERDFGHF